MVAINPPDLSELLSRGLPEGRMIDAFPFAEQLRRMWDTNTPEGCANLEHSRAVLEKMNILIGPEPWKILRGAGEGRMAEVKVKVSKHLGEQGVSDEMKLLFQLAAVYHDIGKYIIRERHPTIGWYTMQYLSPEDKAHLLKLLNQNEEALHLLLIMVRDHDQFGTLCTGEASYPILLNALSSVGGTPEEQKRVLSAIMWLNLADMAAALGSRFNKEDVNKVLFDWEWMCAAVETCAAERHRLDEYLIREASREELVIMRLGRLVMESSRRFPERHKQFQGSRSSEALIHYVVRTQLSTVYGTQAPRLQFASEFTHIVKLDYGLRFFTRLVEYCEGPRAPQGQAGCLPFTAEKTVDRDRLIYGILAILRRITSTYMAMSRSAEGPGNLVGVEMKDLTPANAPEKTAQMCRLLIESQYSGLSWMMSDCPAWFF